MENNLNRHNILFVFSPPDSGIRYATRTCDHKRYTEPTTDTTSTK